MIRPNKNHRRKMAPVRANDNSPQIRPKIKIIEGK
jgi:hypothetical protein